ncbi:MAG: hypothetical protein CSA86_01790 [Arcobacter sp.]|nr:MAG: hypothetical protein CSA86_01790 [Arcobacter sp.]
MSVTQEQLNQQQFDLNEQLLNNGKNWSWLKPAGVFVGAANMGMNIGMYGHKRRNLKSQTKYYDAQTDDIRDRIADRKEVREHNRRVMR